MNNSMFAFALTYCKGCLVPAHNFFKMKYLMYSVN